MKPGAVNGELRALLLDFDGTIAETERFGHRVAYNRAFRELGFDWNWDEDLYGELLAVAGGQERLLSYVRRYHPELSPSGLVDEGLIAELHRVKGRHFATMAGAIPLRPGVARLLGEAHGAGLRIAIATTALRSGVEALLAHHAELAATVDVIAANDSVGRKKPAPDVFLFALAQLELDAGDCVAIEDSNVGLRSALAANLTTIITVSDYTSGEDFSGAAAVLSDLGEPDAHARSLSGPVPSRGFVDLAFLRAVHAAR